MSNYDDDRPNWREIDRNKDKSGFYGRQDKGEKKEGGGRVLSNTINYTKRFINPMAREPF